MDTSLLPFTYLIPLGLLFTAWGPVPTAQLRESALAALVMIVVSAVAYFGFGFALQFGGVGLGSAVPGGLAGLDQAWSPFPAVAGRWGFTGLEGFFVSAEGMSGSLTLMETLALHRLPLAMAAGLVPVVALGHRADRAAMIAAGIVSSAIVFPVVGSWVWGGGWLAALGVNLNLGHGSIDAAGSGIVYFASACVALAAYRVLDSAKDTVLTESNLPMSRQPLLAMLGAILFSAGGSAWLLSDPLLSELDAIRFEGGIVTGLIGVAAATIVVSGYLWLVTGRLHVTMAARGWLIGWIAVCASVWFVPPGSAVVIGLIAGGLLIIGQYASERIWGLSERAGILAACGAGGAWGLLAAGLFADGAFGAGWNGVAVTHGVRGILSGDPGQLTAQIATLIAIGVFAVGVAVPTLFAFTTIARRISRIGLQRKVHASTTVAPPTTPEPD